MVSLTRKNGVTVRLDAGFDVDKEMAEYSVTVSGTGALYTKVCFGNFKSAAKTYKRLSQVAENGGDMNEAMENFFGKAVA